MTINANSCTRCGRCVRVCPSQILAQSKAGGDVSVENFASCIACGHCAAACPTGSVEHSDFTANKVHSIDYAEMPTPQQMMLLIKARRSNRAFSDKAIPSAHLDLIVQAAHRAPTASNAQGVSFTLVTDPALVAAISDYTVSVFEGVYKKLTNPLIKMVLKPFAAKIYALIPLFERLMTSRAEGRDVILRGASAVLFIHTPGESRFGAADANLAYQNGSLMAESLGVSQFYTGFVCSAIGQDKKRGLNELLGIKGTIHAGMALGMPAFRMNSYIDKKPVMVVKK